MGSLVGVRVCDLSGQLAGAGATRFLAAFGAEVIRVEDPVRQGRWDVLRGQQPFVDDRRGIELGGAFNNHNVEKLGVTINLRTDRGRELLRKLIAQSDVITENFAAGVFARLGFSFQELQDVRSDIIYVSNCGFGGDGPYQAFKSWGPIVQACSGLTFSSGLAGMPSAGFGYSYMDHQGANFMALAILSALVHRDRTGEGQWVDMSCTEAGATLTGPAVLDYTVNGRPLRRPGMPDSNHSQFPLMAPHNIYETQGEDEWVAIACRDDDDWLALTTIIDEPWARAPRFATAANRYEHEGELDQAISRWTGARNRWKIAEMLQSRSVPAAAVARPRERIDEDPNTAAWGLWPWVTHPEIGRVRVDGLPIHLSDTDWSITRGAPTLGEHNDDVFTRILGLDEEELSVLKREGVI